MQKTYTKIIAILAGCVALAAMALPFLFPTHPSNPALSVMIASIALIVALSGTMLVSLAPQSGTIAGSTQMPTRLHVSVNCCASEVSIEITDSGVVVKLMHHESRIKSRREHSEFPLYADTSSEIESADGNEQKAIQKVQPSGFLARLLFRLSKKQR